MHHRKFTCNFTFFQRQLYGQLAGYSGKISKKIDLKYHIGFVHGNSGLQCEHCEFTARYETQMDRHLFEKHDQTICSECGQNFTDFSAYDRHRRSHNPLKCQYCPAVFNYLSGLRKHENNHEKNPEANQEKTSAGKMEMCPKCGKHFSENSMKRHLMWFHGAPEPCPWCGVVVKNIKRHLKKVQCDVPEDQRTTKKERSPCHICSKMIESKLLKNHLTKC